MREKWLSQLALLLILVSPLYAQEAVPGADGVGDSLYPALGNGGYDAQHYTLDLAWDDKTDAISGTVTMDARATQALSAFNLDFMGFEISRLTVNGSPADYSRRQRELTITPVSPLAEGDDFSVAVTYSGIPGEGVPNYNNLFLAGWTRYKTGVFVASEPDGASLWFPVNDHPLDKATYTIRMTVPQPYMVAANGMLQEKIDDGDMLTYVWQAKDPMASYLVTVGIDQYLVQNQEGPDGLPIRNYFPPHLFPQAIITFQNTPSMIEYFSSVFGPYPFEAYGVLMADDTLYFALETQTLSLFGPESLTSERAGGADTVISHELAHQWFGDSVSVADWKDIWLNEGFATYASWLWYEHVKGRAYLEGMARDNYEVITSSSFLRYAAPPGSPKPDDPFNEAIYLRGAWTLHALRLRVGDERFFNILRTYYDRYKYGNARTADFIAVAEEISGEDLQAFFDGWLYEEDVPEAPGMGV